MTKKHYGYSPTGKGWGSATPEQRKQIAAKAKADLDFMRKAQEAKKDAEQPKH
jgi:hypothetical protein